MAKGEADVYFRHNPTMEWDTAAMQCIVEEAGGIFMQMDDTPMLYNREDSLIAKGFYAINSLGLSSRIRVERQIGRRRIYGDERHSEREDRHAALSPGEETTQRFPIVPSRTNSHLSG